MAWWNRNKSEPAQQQESRANLEDATVPISSESLSEALIIAGMSATGIKVNLENAMTVPAVWAAINFISGTLAGLPLHVYEKTEDGREKIDGDLANLLNSAVNEECTSFEWRKYSFERTLSGGRSITYIERNAAKKIIALWPLDPSKVTVKLKDGQKFYSYKPSKGRSDTYAAKDIIDIPFMLKPDRVTALSPVLKHNDTIGLGIAATNYGSRFFNNGGVPPFVLVGNFQSGAAMKRASSDMEEAVLNAAREGRSALAVPAGHEIKPVGADPEKSQLVELKRFVVEEVARIYSLPPNFLQDLTRATFSNVEQQDLHLVKHTIKRWAEQTEQELNLKLFGFSNRKYFVKFNLDGVLRGDLKTRMESYAQGIQNAVLKPNEARALENRADDPEGNYLMIQGATVRLGTQPQTPPDTGE